MKTREKIPLELYRIIQLFYKNKLSYVLIKCEHILKGKNSNLDVLFKTDADYNKAASLLEKDGFTIYMSEKVEKYKKMYIKVKDNQLIAIHLHREIAWHNLKVLDKDDIFKNMKKIGEGIFVPSDEDSLIIHIAHIIFENYEIDDETKNLIVSLKNKKLDWGYINKKSEKSGFKKTLDYILKQIKENKQPKKSILINQFIKKAIVSPISWLPIKLKVLRFILRKLSIKRKGCLVALIGVNGSGKTTLARKTLEEYKQITDFFSGQFGYYFGWEPFSFYAKSLSMLMRKRNKKLFSDMNYSGQKNDRFSLFKEILFVYNFLEYLQRYLFIIYPRLRRRQLVITDRYFYDMYGQYNYAQTSKLLHFLLKLYPKPDFLFVLTAPAGVVQNRGKEGKTFSEKRKSDQRSFIDTNILEEQIQRYQQLAKEMNGKSINTQKNITENSKQIIDLSWRKLIR